MSAAARIRSLAVKEAIQLLRDRATLGMLIGVPVLQLLLFGFAIELTPHRIDVTVVSTDEGAGARLQREMASGSDAAKVYVTASAHEAHERLTRGETVVVVDADARPVRITIDASDPVLAAYAVSAVERYTRRLSDAYDGLAEFPSPVRIERLFNPELRTQPYLVSGLLGLILTMTLVMMSALCVARERERGTLDGLVALAVTPLELAAGKSLPYLLLGLTQAIVVLLVARLAFAAPLAGSLVLLCAATLIFALANLALGFLFSVLAPTQMAAMQMTFFFFLPSSLLSGFMFPFSAMPGWAQWIGNLLPLTHFLRIVRGLAFRGADATFVGGELLPILVFAAVVAAAALRRSGRVLTGD